ncbi:AAA family ATPase [Succinimonas sp.]|uniref:AAA family ATPase n=1 Tax=Succinimonas sp. TaxID=1936151 RepID=UPI00386E5D5B
MDNTKQTFDGPKWHRELGIFNRIKPLIILEGNILDKYVYPEENNYASKGEILDLNSYLYAFYKNLGYQHVIFYSHIRGFFTDANDSENAMDEFGKLVNQNVETQGLNKVIQAQFTGRAPTAPDVVSMALEQEVESAVIIMDFVSRYIVAPNSMQQPDVLSFTKLQESALRGKDVEVANGVRLKNSLVLLVNKVNDLPSWLFLDNPSAKTITISTPGKDERFNFIDTQFRSFFDSDIYREDMAAYQGESGQDAIYKLKQRFTGLTAGFSYTALNGLSLLSRKQRFRISDLCKVVDLYRFGITDNPWQTLKHDDFAHAEEDFRKRVKGQDLALTRTLDVIKRAIVGMDGLQHSSHTKPKGVLFFAGPTGTGKTETAKTLAQKLFGDESRCIRFDMSEFGQSHSDQRLLGAPPGYVGYEAGGQLTNAVRDNPFSILLFDEIEKAHPTILDKFLQILEDGRLTDGQGNTVYFSESVIIFTSNLGIYVPDRDGGRRKNVTPEEPYEDVQKKVRAAIENHFKFTLNRPEILNRIGENIVVFDFIRPDVAADILASLLERICENLLRNKKIGLVLDERAVAELNALALRNLDNGGRGIGNVVESYLINPLSRYLFDNRVEQNADIKVLSVVAGDIKSIAETPAVLKCELTRHDQGEA